MAHLLQTGCAAAAAAAAAAAVPLDFRFHLMTAPCGAGFVYVSEAEAQANAQAICDAIIANGGDPMEVVEVGRAGGPSIDGPGLGCQYSADGCARGAWSGHCLKAVCKEDVPPPPPPPPPSGCEFAHAIEPDTEYSGLLDDWAAASAASCKANCCEGASSTR